MKTFVNDKEKVTTAVFTDTDNIARNKVLKRLGVDVLRFNLEDSWGYNDGILTKALCLDKLKMKNSYRATVKCNKDDIYDTDTGKEYAGEKVRRNVAKAVQNAMLRWQIALLHKIKEISPETFNEAVHKVADCKCKIDGVENDS